MKYGSNGGARKATLLVKTTADVAAGRSGRHSAGANRNPGPSRYRPQRQWQALSAATRSRRARTAEPYPAVRRVRLGPAEAAAAKWRRAALARARGPQGAPGPCARAPRLAGPTPGQAAAAPEYASPRQTAWGEVTAPGRGQVRAPAPGRAPPGTTCTSPRASAPRHTQR